MQRLSEQILVHAEGLPEGAPVSAKGLLHLGNRAAVDQALSRLVERGRLIRAGRYELALVLCRSFSERAVAELRDAFQYRLGLCLEGLGRWDDALSTYRQLASHALSPRVAAIASLGQARVWLRMRRKRSHDHASGSGSI